MSIPPNIGLEIVDKDNKNLRLKLKFTGLNPDRSTKFYWKVKDNEGNILSDDMFLAEVPKGVSQWTSPYLDEFYLTIDEQTGENVTLEFQGDLIYDIECNVTIDGESTSLVTTGNFKFEVVWRGLPYVVNDSFTYKQTGDFAADIFATLEVVYPYASTIGVKGTLFELYLEDAIGTTLLAKGYLHKAIQNGGRFDGYNNLIFYFDNIGYDGESVDIRFSVLASDGDKYIIKMTNQYYDDNDEIDEIGPSTASLVLSIVSEKPQLKFEVIPEDVYSYDNGRVTGVIINNIKINYADWNAFTTRLSNYYNYPELNIDRSDVIMGERLTASRWNAVIKTLKRYYEANGLELDERIQEVVKGQKITPEIFILVNDAFQY